ncbi:hypothetical protein CkP1_0105 [Citrobacter phage CkP1]|nr:hypothetical protein CkP1_0105 [Citrobacter phage CkP1]
MKIGFIHNEKVIERVKIEVGDYLKVEHLLEIYEIKIVGISNYVDQDSYYNQNVIFGTVVGDPGAVIQINFTDESFYYFGTDSFKADFYSELYDSKDVKITFENNAPLKSKECVKKIFTPIAVGDVLVKPSRTGEFKVVYVNDHKTHVVVENTLTGKIELISHNDKNAIKIFGLILNEGNNNVVC